MVAHIVAMACFGSKEVSRRDMGLADCDWLEMPISKSFFFVFAHQTRFERQTCSQRSVREEISSIR